MKISFLIIIFLGINFNSSGQISLKNLKYDTVKKLSLIHIPSFLDNNFSLVNLSQPSGIPQNYYTQHLSFFCKQELKMKQAHVPVSIRVGQLEDCNYLEQKPNVFIY